MKLNQKPKLVPSLNLDWTPKTTSWIGTPGLPQYTIVTDHLISQSTSMPSMSKSKPKFNLVGRGTLRLKEMAANFYGYLYVRDHATSQRERKNVEKAEFAFEQLVRIMADSLKDYIFLVCMAEARHAQSQHDLPVYIDELLKTDKPMPRISVFNLATEYSPSKNLPILIKLFGTPGWEMKYGGPAWQRIAEGGMMYEQVVAPVGEEQKHSAEIVWIDHILDLAHNGGPFFDKEVIFDWRGGDSTNLLTGQTYRLADEPIRKILNGFNIHQLWEGLENVLLPYISDVDNLEPAESALYQPIVWGDKVVSVQNKTRCKETSCDFKYHIPGEECDG